MIKLFSGNGLIDYRYGVPKAVKVAIERVLSKIAQSGNKFLANQPRSIESGDIYGVKSHDSVHLKKYQPRH